MLTGQPCHQKETAVPTKKGAIKIRRWSSKSNAIGLVFIGTSYSLCSLPGVEVFE